MQEHNRVMNISNEDWIHVNRFIRSASPNGSSQDWISEVYLHVHVLRMLENSGRVISPKSGQRQRNK